MIRISEAHLKRRFVIRLVAVSMLMTFVGLASVVAQESVVKPPPLTRPQTDQRSDDEAPKTVPGIAVSGQLQKLAEIEQSMKAVAAQLEKASYRGETEELQLEILASIDEMLKSQGSNNSPNLQPASSQEKRAQDEEQETGDEETNDQEQVESDGNASSPDGESGVSPNPLDRGGDFDAVWGHLPDRVQGALRAALRDEYLPKYEKLIESYYKSLAGAKRNRP